jgi:hypothetical protein
MKHHRNIRRYHDNRKHTFGWLVTLQRNHKIHVKFFSDSVYGGKRTAFRIALQYRNALIEASTPGRYRRWRRTILRRNNTSGIVGVGRYDQVVNRHTDQHRVFWLAYWNDEHGKRRQRRFSVLLYGEQKAKQLAMAERERQLNAVLSAMKSAGR